MPFPIPNLSPDDRMESDPSRNSISVGVSARITRILLGTNVGRNLPMIGLTEFPKSGGTWVGSVLANYFGIPFPQRPRLPVLMRCIWHGHWGPKNKADILVVRDPRDCYLSLFHHRVSMMRSAVGSERNSNLNKKFISEFPHLSSGASITLSDSTLYFSMLLNNNYLGEPDWIQFHRDWLSNGAPAIVRYDRLRDSPVETFSELIRILSGNVSQAKLEHAVARNEFGLMKSSGGDFVRSGKARGGWKAEVSVDLHDDLALLFPDDIAEGFGFK